jgi:hypothetical protein
VKLNHIFYIPRASKATRPPKTTPSAFTLKLLAAPVNNTGLEVEEPAEVELVIELIVLLGVELGIRVEEPSAHFVHAGAEDVVDVIVSVVTWPIGQLVTDGLQEVTVYTVVEQMVDVLSGLLLEDAEDDAIVPDELLLADDGPSDVEEALVEDGGPVDVGLSVEYISMNTVGLAKLGEKSFSLTLK